MEFLIALILGGVHGLTEFLPVSSTGHLVILERLARLQIPALTFHVFLHAGTLIVLLITMREEYLLVARESFGIIRDMLHNLNMFLHLLKGDEIRYVRILNSNYRCVAAIVMSSTLIISAVGFFMRDIVEYTSGSLLLNGVGFWITALILYVTEKVKPGNEIAKDVPHLRTLLIGLAGSAAVFPGISAFAILISMGIFLGFSRKYAIHVAWMIMVPVEAAALISGITQSAVAGVLSGRVLAFSAVGTLGAAGVGILFFGAARQLLHNKSFRVFAKYCFWFGNASVALNFLLNSLGF